MKKRNLVAIMMVVLMLLSLTACGGASKNEMAMEYAYDSAAPMEPMRNDMLTSDSASGAMALPADRKLIRTVSVDAETEELEPLLTAVDEMIAQLEGYVESREVYNGSTYSNRRYRNANLTIRIPAERADQLIAHVSGISNVVSSNETIEDVTLTYVDTETRVKALETERDRLLELMEQAQNLSEILEIESRLTEVRYQLESTASMLKTLENQVSYATIHLHITEVQEYTPVAEKTPWQRITEGFVDSLEGIWDGAVETFIWVLANSPYIVVFGGIGFGVTVLLRKRKSSGKKWFRKNKKAE